MCVQRRPLTLLAWCLIGASLAAQPVPALSRALADSFARKVLTIRQYGEVPPKGNGQRVTPVSEPEVNSYLQFTIAPDLPTGVVDPSVVIVGDGQLQGRAVVDLDAVAKAKASGAFNPIRLLSGRLPVTASGVLRTADGRGQFELSRAEISGIPIPKTLLQEIVSYYSRSSQFPEGVAIDAPFALPARIKEIHINAQQAVVVQ
jgi:hypothetical protein